MPTLITIREQPGAAGANAVVSFDHGAEHPATIADPYTLKQEAELEWYFEEYLRFPFVDQVRFREVAAGIPGYGEALFRQAFADAKAQRAYGAALADGLENLTFEIKGSPEFHHLHWEALKDPELPRSYALDCPVLRRNTTPAAIEHRPKPSDTLRVLLVTSRPFGDKDVAYRTISRPLTEALDNARLPVEIHILRPGSYRALVEHLEETRDRHGAGRYHIAHFDTHGAVLSHEQLVEAAFSHDYALKNRYSRSDIAPYEGQKGFLFLDGESVDTSADPVAANELADLLTDHGIHAVVLNACQSGKQVGGSESSLGARLMQAGVQWVLAMGYSVTVSAAECLMTELYRRLFDGETLTKALQRARLALHNDKDRRVYYDQRIPLEDWLLPVVYENNPLALSLASLDPGARSQRLHQQARQYRAPTDEYGFHGRDMDILRIERRLLADNNLLLRGMAGVGKSSLLRHLAQWWQTTRFVKRIWHFSFEERAWPLDMLFHHLALGDAHRPGSGLLSKQEQQSWHGLAAGAQQAWIIEHLRADRHLLILDNLESVTAAHLDIPNKQQVRLRAFIEQLAGGRCFILLGSRAPENWLIGADPRRVYELPGLDPEAASTLAERVLKRHGADHYRADSDLKRLLKLLAGFPLAIEVILANMAGQTPGETLAALSKGAAAIDLGNARLLCCIKLSYERFSPVTQNLLACLAPFCGVFYQGLIEPYSNNLRQQAVLADLPFERWQEMLEEAANCGLVTHHEEKHYLSLQPTLSWFLRRRLAGRRENAILTAFRKTMAERGDTLSDLFQSSVPQERQAGQLFTELEYENLLQALELALAAKVSFVNLFFLFSDYFDATHEETRGLELGQHVMERLETWLAEAPSGPIGIELVIVVTEVAKRYLRLKRYAESTAANSKALEFLDTNVTIPSKTAALARASVYHKLGMVADEQCLWPQAEDYYHKALDIHIEFEARYDQACSYHQLGNTALGQRLWHQAEDCYRKSLDILIEFNDRLGQAGDYHQLGNTALQQRLWHQAEDCYRKALNIHIEFNDRHSQAINYHQLGMVAQEQRLWPEAEGYYRNALDIKIEFNDRYEQARTYYQLGRVVEEQRLWFQAEDYYRKALDIYIEFNVRYGQANTYHQLGRAAQKQHFWLQAEDYYRKALDIKIELDARCEQASTYHQLGIVTQEQRLWPQAEDCYHKALDIFIEFNDRREQAATYHQLGSVAEECGQGAEAVNSYRALN